MNRLVAVALALIVLAGTHAAMFALGAASTRIPPTVLVDTTPTTTRLVPAAGAVRVRVAGNCLVTGTVEAAKNGWKPDSTCEPKVGP